jgi:hypothetical protein
LCLKLILRLLLVVYASLYRSTHAGIWIEYGSAIDPAAPRDIKFWHIVHDRNNQLRSKGYDRNWNQHFVLRTKSSLSPGNMSVLDRRIPVRLGSNNEGQGCYIHRKKWANKGPSSLAGKCSIDQRDENSERARGASNTFKFSEISESLR